MGFFVEDPLKVRKVDALERIAHCLELYMQIKHPLKSERTQPREASELLKTDIEELNELDRLAQVGADRDRYLADD